MLPGHGEIDSMNEDGVRRAAGSKDAPRVEEALRAAELTGDALVFWPEESNRPWALVTPDPEAVRAGGFVNLYEAMRFRLENASMALPPELRPRGWTLARRAWPVDEGGEPSRERMRAELGPAPPRVWPQEPEERNPLPGGWQRALEGAPFPSMPEGPLLREHSLEYDLGVDSLDRLAFVLAVADATGIEADEEIHASLFTLGDVVDAFPEPAGVVGDWSVPRVLEPPRPLSLPLACKPLRLRRPLVALFRVGLQIWTRRRHKTELVGLERVDWSRRPLLIAQNHGSVLDPVLVAIELPRRIHRHTFFVGFSGYFSQGAGKLLSWIFRIVPIDADAGALRGLRLVAEALRRKEILVIYPEGERSLDGRLLPLRRGAAWLAAETGAAVVPSAISGSYQAAPRGYPMTEHPVRVAFGPAIEPPASHDKQDVEDFTARLRAAISTLMRELGDDPVEGDQLTWAKGPPSIRLAKGSTD